MTHVVLEVDTNISEKDDASIFITEMLRVRMLQNYVLKVKRNVETTHLSAAKTTRCQNPENHNLNTLLREKLQTYKIQNHGLIVKNPLTAQYSLFVCNILQEKFLRIKITTPTSAVPVSFSKTPTVPKHHSHRLINRNS